MHVVITGCGRTGRALATRLDAEGDKVTVIELDDTVERGLPAGARQEVEEQWYVQDWVVLRWDMTHMRELRPLPEMLCERGELPGQPVIIRCHRRYSLGPPE